MRGSDKNARDIRLTRATIQITSVPAHKYDAMCGLGDIKAKRGDLKDALNSYNECLALIESLVKSDPGDAQWQRDLSVSRSKVGDVQKAQGDLGGAFKSYEESLAI